MADPDPIVADRAEALRGLDAEGRATVAARVPLLAAALIGRGPLGYTRAGRPDPLDGLARQLASPVGIGVSLLSCSPVAVALAQVLAWHGGWVGSDLLAGEAAPLERDALEAAAEELCGALLARRRPDGLALRPGVAELVDPVGIAVRDLAGNGSLTVSDLDRWLTVLGAPIDRTSRRSRLTCLERALGDPEVVRAVLDRCSPEAHDAFARLLRHPGGVPVSELGCPYFFGGMAARTMLRPGWGRPRTAVDELVEAGLARVDVEAQVCFLLLDTVVAMNGRLHGTWPAPPVRAEAALGDTGGPPAAPGRVRALVDSWRRRPAEGLKTGGLGVRTLASAAKQLGMPEVDGKVLGRLARRLGLVEPVERLEGIGKRATVRVEFVPSARADAFDVAPFAERWAALVGAWLDEDDPGPEISFLRRSIVADLAELPAGTGIAAGAFTRWATGARVLYDTRTAHLADVIDGLRVLGLVPGSGPIGLTDAARTVLVDPAALRFETAGRIIVQADHTVVVPPDVDPDVAARLERLAVPVSVGAARVFQLDPDRIGAAVAQGESAEQIRALLSPPGAGPLPAPVERLVTDAARAAGGLRSLEAACVIVAADAAGLARAVAVKAARLSPVAPTVAVSPLPSAKVAAALRAKGVHLEAAAAVSPARPARAASSVTLGAAGPLQLDHAGLVELLSGAR